MDLSKIYENKKLLVIQCNRNFFETIARNQYFRSHLMELGFDPKKFNMQYTFRYFYEKLFKLTPASQAKYEKYLKMAKPTIDTKMVCAQVRIGGHRDLQKELPTKGNDFLFQPVTNTHKY